MVREVGKIYSRSFRMLFKYPQFLLLTAAYLFFTYADRYIDNLLRASDSLGLYVLIYWIKFPLFFCVFTGFPLALLFMVNQTEDRVDLKAIFQKTKEYFWKYFRQRLAGLLLTLAYALPVAFLVVFSVFMDDAIFLVIVLQLFFIVCGYLGLGFISMSERILLDGGNGAFRNSLCGLRMLSANFSYFATLFFITTLISVVFFPIRYVLGSYFTGIDLFAVPVLDFRSFMTNIYYATNIPIVYTWDFLYSLIIWPFYTILYSLAYQHVKGAKTLQLTHET